MQYRTLIEILHCMHECFISIRREIDKIYVFQGYPILEVYTRCSYGISQRICLS